MTDREGYGRRALIMVLLGCALVAGLQRSASCGIIVEFNFNDNNSVVDFVAANLAGTNYGDGGGLTNISFVAQAAARGFNPSSSAAAALSRGDYWQFTVTASPGYHLDLADLLLDERHNAKGPVAFQVDLNGLLQTPALASSSSFVTHSVNLSTFTNLTSLTIRLLAWNAQNNGNAAQWFNDNVRLEGEVVPDATHSPEPTSLVLWGALALLGMGYAGYRKRACVARASSP